MAGREGAVLIGLMEFLLVVGLVLAFAISQLWPLYRDKRRAEQARATEPTQGPSAEQ